MKRFIGLMPSWVWGGIVETYTDCSLIGAQYLLASRVEAIVGAETLHWAILNRKKDLLLALLENDSNPNEAGKRALRCAMEASRSEMADVLLHWAIVQNRGDFLKTLLALVSDQNVLDNALTHAKKMRRVNSSAVTMVLERFESLGLVASYQG